MHTYVPKWMPIGRISSIDTMSIQCTLYFVFGYNTNGGYVQKTEFVCLMHQRRIVHTYVPKSMPIGRISRIDTMSIQCTLYFVFRYYTNGAYVQKTESVRLMHQTRIVHTCVPKTMPVGRISSIDTMSIQCTLYFVFQYKNNYVFVQKTKFGRVMH